MVVLKALAVLGLAMTIGSMALLLVGAARRVVAWLDAGLDD